MSLITISLAFGVLFVVGLLWFLLYYIANPVLENPDGIAKIVGNCGDTMEIGLQIKDGRVSATHHWTNGCSFSKRCVESAARQAKGKTIQELNKVNMISIMDEIGRLPDTHLHCAQLAETTLQHSLQNYLDRQHKAPTQSGTM